MRFFYSLLNAVSVVLRLTVIASPFLFSFMSKDRDFDFVLSTHQYIYAPLCSLLYAFVLFGIGEMRPYLRYLRSVRSGAVRPAPKTSANHFDWLIPGTPEFKLFHDNPLDDYFYDDGLPVHV